MNQVTSRKEDLKNRINELEESLATLKDALRKEEEAEQHKAIDQLECYFSEVNNRFASLQDFWQLLKEDFKKVFSNKSKGD